MLNEFSNICIYICIFGFLISVYILFVYVCLYILNQ